MAEPLGPGAVGGPTLPATASDPANATGIKPGKGSGPLTIKGSPMNKTQEACAASLYSTAKSLNANTTVLVAIMFAAIFESDMGTDLGWDSGNPTYGGPLAGNKKYFGSLGGASSNAVLVAEATAFCQGGKGYNGAIGLSHTYTDPALVAIYAEAPVLQGESLSLTQNQYYADQGGMPAINQVRSEAEAIVQAAGGGTLAGGVAGLGGTGTSIDGTTNAPFTLGTTSVPDQDMWTAINSLAQERQWYLFSDGETLYLADGADLMEQAPVLTIDRWGDADRIISLDFTWDNTAFQYTVNRTKGRKRVVRKSVLQKIQSPVSADLNVVCNIDEVRAGDVVMLTGCGPGDGKWLVGDCTRSVFQIYSELTLVPAVSPLSEAQAAGAGSNSSVTGPAATRPGAGTVIAAMISAASTINNAHLQYVYGGGHDTAGTPSIGIPGNGYNGVTKGFDCSGAVGAVLHAGGLMNGTVPASGGFPAALSQYLVKGAGSGTPECTLYVASFHIFMRLDGQYFGTTTGAGSSPTHGGGSGGYWGTSGSYDQNPGANGFTTYHFPQTVLQGPVGTLAGTPKV